MSHRQLESFILEELTSAFRARPLDGEEQPASSYEDVADRMGALGETTFPCGELG